MTDARQDATVNRAGPEPGRIGRFRSVRARATVFACAGTLVFASIVLLVSHYRIHTIAQEKANAILQEEIVLAATVFAGEFNILRVEALTLADTPPLRGLARAAENGGIDPFDGSTSHAWRNRLETIFSALMLHRPVYQQIRYIGIADNGRELVRVNRTADGLDRVPPDRLQDKGGEDYFRSAIADARAGHVRFSPVTLNRENGRISQPETPVVRVIVPVFDDFGRLFGLVVINADYAAILRRALARLNLAPDILAVNASGDYMLRSEAGTISPLLNRADSDTPALPEAALVAGLTPAAESAAVTVDGRDLQVIVRRILPDAEQPELFLAIGLLWDRATLFADANAATRFNLGLSVVLIALFTLLAYRLARSFTAPLDTVVAGIRSYARGEELAALPTLRRDEIGELSVAFEGLVSELGTTRLKGLRTAKRLETIVENTVDSLITIDAEGNILDFNGGSEAIFGYSADEVVGHNISVLIPQATASQHDSFIARHLSTGQSGIVGSTRPVVGRRKEGREFPLDLSISKIVLDDNQIVFSGILRDSTERQRFERALAASEEMFRLAMQKAPIGMALVHADGRWIEYNEALCDLFGYSAAEMEKLSFREVTHPDDQQVVAPFRDRILSGEIESYQFEKRYVHKSGRTVWALLSVSALPRIGDAPPTLICQLLDISDSKAVEAVKNEFVSVVSHELRTPLTSIRGSLGLILGAMSDELTPGVQQLVSIAHSNCERLIPLINDILDLDKIAAGKMRFDYGLAPVAELLAHAVAANRPFAEKFDVALDLLPIDPDLAIVVDTDRANQVLTNFISNAVKFTPEGSTVTLAATLRGDIVRIAVTDQGDGIPEEFVERIFARFAQADSSVTRQAGGTGLGLHISKQIIEQMGGTIGFDSVHGRGATFWFELPRAERDSGGSVLPAVETPAPDPVAPAALPRILHVEDDRDFARIVKAMLRRDCVVENAPSLAAARRAIRENAFDLIVLDPTLPDGNALDLLAQRGGPLDRTLPVVVVSAEQIPAAEARIVDAAFVKSQATEAEILTRIRSLIVTSSREVMAS